MTVWAAILAAGAGRRLGGRAKALLEHRGSTFLETIVRAARGRPDREDGVQGVVVVCGHHADLVRPAAEKLADVVVTNPDPDRGMGTSARKAARAVPDGAALLLWPVDHPAVQPETVRAVLAAHRANPAKVIVPIASDTSAGGHPTLLPAPLVARLRTLADEDRLDHAVLKDPGAVMKIQVDDPGVARDVDFPEDLAALDD